MSTYHVMHSDHLQSKTKSTQNGHFFDVVSHCLLLAKKTFFAGNNSIVKSSSDVTHRSSNNAILEDLSFNELGANKVFQKSLAFLFS